MNHTEEFRKYIKQIIFEPNKLSKRQIKALGEECIKRANMKPRFITKINSGRLAWAISFLNISIPYGRHFDRIIDEYFRKNRNIYLTTNLCVDPVKDFGLVFPFRINPVWLYYKSLCGALNSGLYQYLYFFDFLGIPIKDSAIRDEWDFCKRSMNVYAIGLREFSWGNDVCIIPKPEEIFIQDDITHCVYDKKYYCNEIEVPKWIYDLKKETLNLDLIKKIKNTYQRTIFIKKAGITRFIKKGKIIDTFENYPENEWWAKSEYRLIDMVNVINANRRQNPPNRLVFADNFTYAPYLCMKNQTTGDYHLEGVSPDCRNLYDALKMRYKDLDLPSYEIKDIK